MFTGQRPSTNLGRLFKKGLFGSGLSLVMIVAVGGASIASAAIRISDTLITADGGAITITAAPLTIATQASTTRLSVVDRIYIGGSATTTLVGDSSTSTLSGGLTLSAGNFNLPTGGVFLINNVKVLDATSLGSAVVGSSLTSVGTLSSLTVSGQTALGQASSSRLSAVDRLYIGGTATTSILGDAATSTFSGGISTNLLFVTSTSASSTFSNGLNLSAGCFSIGGSCIGGSGLTGSGAANRGTFWTSSSALSSDDNFAWDNTNKFLGLGTTTPNYRLQVAGSAGPQVLISEPAAGSDLKHWYASTTAGNLAWGIRNDALSSLTERFRITNAGLFGIGTTTPATTFSVAGNGYLTGGLGVGVATTTAGVLQTSGAAQITGSLTVTGNAAFNSTATSTFAGGLNLTSGNVNLATGGVYLINNAKVLDATSLGSAVVSSSLTSVGALTSGSIASGFGSINIGSNSLTAGAASITSLTASGLAQLTGNASTSLASVTNTLYVGATATATISSTGVVNLPTGATYQINGTNVLSGTTLGSGVTASSLTSVGTLTSLTVSGLTQLSGQASTTRLSAFDRLYIGGSATTTIVGDSSTSTFSGGISTTLLSITGSSTSTAANGINLTGGCFAVSGTCVGGVSGSGTAGQVTFWSSGTALTSDSGLNWDNTNKRLGIGTTTPAWVLQTGATSSPQLALSDTDAGANLKHWTLSSLGGNLIFATASDVYATTSSPSLTITSNGLLGIASSTPAQNLSVTGNTYMTGGLGVGKATTTTGVIETNGAVQIGGSLTVAGNTAFSSTATSTFGGGTQITSQRNTGFLEVVGTSTLATTTIGTSGTAITKHLSGTASLNFGVLAGNACETLTMTVTGAADADTVTLGIPNALASASSTYSWNGFVSAANTVSVRLCQVATQATSDPAAATIRADIWQH